MVLFFKQKGTKKDTKEIRDMIIYHGSGDIIEKPIFGKGNPNNDYGLGFYCTQHPELAKEWACDETHGGYANKYNLNIIGLKMLNLNSGEYSVLHWISILLKNRSFIADTPLAASSKKYISENFAVDTEGYDIITGYRADDSYFSYARDFLQNTISVQKLAEAMRLGDLGNQIVLISEKVFGRLEFIGYETAPQNIYLPLRKKRDEKARTAYFTDRKGNSFSEKEIYILDIMRKEMKSDDICIQ